MRTGLHCVEYADEWTITLGLLLVCFLVHIDQDHIMLRVIVIEDSTV